MVLMTTRALPMKSMEPPMAGLTYSCWDSQKYWPKKFIAVRLAPMWKWTGSSRSAQTSHSGSHARLARSGEPRSWGSEVMLTPRRPRSATRFASRTQPSMSQAGRIGMGSSRLLVLLWISARESLKISRQRRRRTGSFTSARAWPPSPRAVGVEHLVLDPACRRGSRAGRRCPTRASWAFSKSHSTIDSWNGCFSPALSMVLPPPALPSALPSTTQVLIDEAHFLPYIFDLVRLATGTKLAITQNKLSIKPFDAYEAIIEGYAKMLKLGGRGFVLEEDHLKLGLMARHKLKDRCLFWQKLDRDVTPCSTKKWLDGFNVLISQLPPGKTEYRIGQRTIGQGSLGRPRLVAIADHDGGLIAHEVKVCLPSAVVWAGVSQSEELHYNTILDLSFRSKDPFLGETNKVVHRRLSPSCSRVELSDLPRDRDEHLLLGCMGAEAANIHLATPGKDIAQPVLEDLRKRGGAQYLKQCVKVMLEAVRTDHEEWVRHYNKVQQAKAVKR